MAYSSWYSALNNWVAYSVTVVGSVSSPALVVTIKNFLEILKHFAVLQVTGYFNVIAGVVVPKQFYSSVVIFQIFVGGY